MTRDACRLCGRIENLRQSHIVPAFVFRWLKDSSPTGYLRGGSNPNIRAQDGLKRAWLCDSCEGDFSQSEELFARKIFRPLMQGTPTSITYEEWLLRFCVSISWRILSLCLDEGTGKFLRESRPQRAADTLGVWREYLRGERTDLAGHEQYLLNLDGIPQSLLHHPKTNRYFAGVIDAELLETNSELMVYVKLPHLALLGIIETSGALDWQMGPIHHEGVYNIGSQAPPDVVLDFLHYRTEYAHHRGNMLSDRQLKCIEDALARDIEKTRRSGFFQSLRHDVERFGIDQAFGENPGAEDS